MPTSTIPEFIETASYEKGFGIFYHEKIMPALSGIEEKRIQLLAKQKKRMVVAIFAIVTIIIACAGIIILCLKHPDNIKIDGNPSALIGIFGIIWGLLSWAKAPSREYSGNIKSTYMPIICKFFGDLNYSMEGESSIESTLQGELFQKFIGTEMEDFIQGTAKKITFKIHESILERRYPAFQEPSFEGLVIEIQFPKAFKGKTIVLKDEGRVGNFLTNENSKDLTVVHLEDPQFESIFQVYSNNQIEARFLLTTAFMERLIHLKEALSSETIQCEFRDKSLILAINSHKDLFEPRGLSQTALQVEDIHQFLAQMDSIFKLIDVLKISAR